MQVTGRCEACGEPDDYGAAYQLALEKVRQGVPMKNAMEEAIEAARKLKEAFYPEERRVNPCGPGIGG